MSTRGLNRRDVLSRIGWGAAALPLLHARAHGASAPAFPRRLVLFTVPSCGPREIFSDAPYDAPTARLTGLSLRPFGYRWFSLRKQ